jgi:hypothetical protein
MFKVLWVFKVPTKVAGSDANKFQQEKKLEGYKKKSDGRPEKLDGRPKKSDGCKKRKRIRFLLVRVNAA